MILAEHFDLEGGKKTSRSFQINSGKLAAKNHAFTLELFDDQAKRQDYKVVRIKLAKKQATQGTGSQGNLQNVTCTGDTVSIKVWDHSSQDGDIITLKLAGQAVLSNFNMGWKKNNIVGCGGSEPFGPPCAFMNLPFPAGTRVAVSVTAHNQGDGGPNTAALKVEGGCTPELQHWSLSTGETNSIFISRDTSTPQQGGQNASPGQTAGGQSSGTDPGSQSSVQSWP